MVHARDCKAVGTSELSNCSTEGEGYLMTDYVSKLAMEYERDLGVKHDWNGTLRTVNPVKSDLVTQYMAFVREERKRQESKHHKHLLCFTATSRQSSHS